MVINRKINTFIPELYPKNERINMNSLESGSNVQSGLEMIMEKSPDTIVLVDRNLTLVKVISAKDDYYHYDEKNLMLVGEMTGKTYKLSDKVKVRVISCNKKERTIDFEVVGQKSRIKKKKTIQVNDRKVKTNRLKKGKINKSGRQRKYIKKR